PLVTIFLVMWALDPSLTLLSLAVVPVMLLALRLYSRPMQDLSYAQHDAEGRLYDTLEQSLSAIPVVQAFAGEAEGDRRVADDVRRIIRAAIDAMKVQLRFNILVGFATAAGTAAIFWLGAEQALAGHLTVGTIILFVSYVGSLYGPLESLMYTGSTLQNAAGSARR